MNRPFHLYEVVSRFLGLVLLLAGALKVQASTTGLVPETDFWSSRWFLIITSLAEMVFGTWLIVGILPWLSWWLAMAIFGSFLGDNLTKALAGDVSCGCFGQFEVHPWVTFGFDLLAIFLLLIGTPVARPYSSGNYLRARLIMFASMCVIVGAGSFGIYHHFEPRPLTAEGSVDDEAAVIVLQPESWVGQRFPLLAHIDIGSQLDRGNWILMFYRQNCPECKKAIARYVALAYELANRVDGMKVALVEVPTEQATLPAVNSGKMCARARLSGKKRWAGTVPWFLRTNDGVVSIATRSPEVLLNNPWAGTGSNSQFARFYLDGKEDGALFPDYRQARRHMFLQEIACGPLSLIAILQNLAVPLTTDQIEGLLAVAGTHGTDLSQLKELAEKYGLHTLGVAATTGKLRQMGQQAIVHLDRVGFAAVTGYTPDGLKVVYPLQPPGIVPDDLFEKSFGQNGYALLLSRMPLPPNALGIAPAPVRQIDGPVLELNKNSISVGRINSYRWEGFLTYLNAGSRPLEISRVDSSCPCMTGTVDKAQLLPGETGILHAVGEQRSIGKFLYYFTVTTNQEDPEKVKIPVQGYVEHPVAFYQPAWVVTGLLPNRPIAIEVPFDLSPGIDPDSLQAEVPEDSPLSATLIRRPKQGLGLRIQWKGDQKIGWHRFQIDVKLRDVKSPVIAPFHVAVEIVPTVDASPAYLLVRDEELTQEWSRFITYRFRPHFDGGYSIGWKGYDLSELVKVEKISQTQDTLTLRLAPVNANTALGISGKQASLMLSRPGEEPCLVRFMAGEAALGKKVNKGSGPQKTEEKP
jgi:hypothetical protein